MSIVKLYERAQLGLNALSARKALEKGKEKERLEKEHKDHKDREKSNRKKILPVSQIEKEGSVITEDIGMTTKITEGMRKVIVTVIVIAPFITIGATATVIPVQTIMGGPTCSTREAKALHINYLQSS